jgi:hypothetical protein
MENKTMTSQGSMSGVRTALPVTTEELFDRILEQWQAAVNHKHHDVSKFTHSADQVHGTFGLKYARLDIGGSGAFMVEMSTGIVYGIKGYGQVDKKKISGNIYDPSFDAAVLVNTRFQYGRFDLRKPEDRADVGVR